MHTYASYAGILYVFTLILYPDKLLSKHRNVYVYMYIYNKR